MSIWISLGSNGNKSLISKPAYVCVAVEVVTQFMLLLIPPHWPHFSSQEVRKAAASVLKSFQTEVDRLTVRCQKAEDAFIQVYQRLAEMPGTISSTDQQFQIHLLEWYLIAVTYHSKEF